MRRILVSVVVPGLMIALALALGTGHPSAKAPKKPKVPVGIHKIKHVIVIMQENRSFDQYFGTYPGADGIPRNSDGSVAVCVPNPADGGCEKPFEHTGDSS